MYSVCVGGGVGGEGWGCVYAYKYVLCELLTLLFIKMFNFVFYFLTFSYPFFLESDIFL